MSGEVGEEIPLQSTTSSCCVALRAAARSAAAAARCSPHHIRIGVTPLRPEARSKATPSIDTQQPRNALQQHRTSTPRPIATRPATPAPRVLSRPVEMVTQRGRPRSTLVNSEQRARASFSTPRRARAAVQATTTPHPAAAALRRALRRRCATYQLMGPTGHATHKTPGNAAGHAAKKRIDFQIRSII